MRLEIRKIRNGIKNQFHVMESTCSDSEEVSESEQVDNNVKNNTNMLIIY